MTTNIKKWILILLLTALAGFSAYCQDVLTVPANQYAPTPKALEMTRYGHMPPDLNSGVYSHDIPIYTYEDKDFSIPVSLHYSSSGFQPARMSDEAGLHWTLMAGGAITREIVGVDDFSDDGLYNSYATVNDSIMYRMIKPSNITHGFFTYHDHNTPSLYGEYEECSSDRYHFSFPGHSGSFVMNHSGTGFIVYGTEAGHGMYDISYDGSSKSFTITTGDGYQYRFGHGETGDAGLDNEAKEFNWSREAVRPTDQATQLYVSSTHVVTWLLDSITAPNGNTVSFKYQSIRSKQDIPQANDDVLTSFSRHLYELPKVDPNNQIIPDQYENYYKSASLTYTTYLKRIIVDKPLCSGETLQVDFAWKRESAAEVNTTDSDRYRPLVAPRSHLDTVTVRAGARVLRRAILHYTPSGLRPLLTSVDLSNLGTYSMEYWTDSANPLPGILCNGLDFWGYYNGQNNVPDAFICPMGIDENLNESISSGEMDPSWTHARLGTLKKITYPTGGWTSIDYESNQANKIVLRRKTETAGLEPSNPIGEPGSGSQNDVTSFLPSLFSIGALNRPFVPQCGGVRVKTLTDSDGINTSTEAYTYSGGIVQQFPRFFVGYKGTTPEFSPALRFPGSGFDQRHVAYNTVTCTRPDSSRVVTNFTGWEDCPDEYSPYHESVVGIAPLTDTLQQLFYDHILREPDSRAYRRGLPILRRSFDKNGTKVSEEEWQYSDVGSDYNTYALISGQYYWTARTFLCDRKPSLYVRKEWFDNTANEQTEQTDYAYNDLGQLRQTSRTAGGHTETQKTTYPGDISGGVYPAMAAANYLEMPVEQVTIRDGKVTQGSLTTYGSYYNLYLPSATYQGNTRDGLTEEWFFPYQGTAVDGTFYELDNSFVGYDNVGNVTLSLNREGTPTTYYWDKRQDKLSAIFVGGRNGVHSTYARGALSQTEMEIYINADPAEKTFTCDMAGSFSFSFTSVDTTNVITAKLDGSSIAVPRIGNGAQGTATPIPISSGTHTLQIVGTELHLRAHPIEDSPVSGTLSITYPKSGAVLVEANGQDCFFEDFESSTDGVLDFGFESSRGRVHTYSKTISVIPNRTYYLDYMQKVNGEWQYMRESFTPTSGSLTLTISAQQSSPVDHVRFYPADCAAASFTWWPTGELRCRVDGDGLKETYEYDTLGRLIHVRDNDGNIVKEYSYNYIH